MQTSRALYFAITAAIAFGAIRHVSAAEPSVHRIEDVIYGRKYGLALTLDVFKPAKPNGVAVVLAVSSGFHSAHESIKPELFPPFLNRGHTVFAVVHGSQPRFTIPEILTDMHQAIRFIRGHAEEYGIDPQRIGIMGGSAGGYLSLMQGVAGPEGDAASADAIQRESSRVQAVACLFPPTDFLNYGEPGEVALGRGRLKDFPAPFDFQELIASPPRFVPITDEAKILDIGRQISPVTHVSPDDPPTLIIHGEDDVLVPVQQGRLFVDKLTSVGVEAKLIVKPGVGHGWPDMMPDLELLAEWFEEHLSAKP